GCCRYPPRPADSWRRLNRNTLQLAGNLADELRQSLTGDGRDGQHFAIEFPLQASADFFTVRQFTLRQGDNFRLVHERRAIEFQLAANIAVVRNGIAVVCRKWLNQVD